ncbi:heptaprenyl diphosphate synthase component 1 [Salirhabdus salicampi]|uniref:heptaprenyl diphosphate synthase component 1 n=1 Tax=Salirhabdus salicampi TaxID=476102 RepID=UPI0020C38EC8|nr:heptaprenyl diphosphate synthase component 1 [Salirhabdus salicampi]MCP8616704.1 heptaprenyl diphosphate synthase component 1 [Salirhabdus salicampi]
MSIHNEIYEIKQKIHGRINHPYMSEKVDQPSISEDKIFFLKLFIEESIKGVDYKETYLVATMLMQIAMDTHDQVPEQLASEAFHKQQLTVLAGDLYSGLFYEGLAQLEDVSLIQALAGAVREMNERKMTVYHNQFHKLEDLLCEVREIESMLIKKVAEYFQMPDIVEIMSDWLLIKRLQVESEHNHQKDFSPHLTFTLGEERLSLGGKVRPLIHEKTKELTSKVYEQVQNLHNDHIKGKLLEWFHGLPSQEILLEEG